MNKPILTIVVAGTLALGAVPACAQLLGGGLGGTLSGTLGGTLNSPMGGSGLGGTLDGAGEGQFGLDPDLSSVNQRVLATRSRVKEGAKGAAEAAKPGEATPSSKPAQGDLLGNVAASTGMEGAVEREAAGRRVAGSGSSKQDVTHDEQGLALLSSNAADASITQVQEPAAQESAAEPASPTAK